QVPFVGRADDRPPAWSGFDRHHTLDLEEAHGLSQRPPTDLVVDEHLALGRQHRAGLEAVVDDVAHDAPGQQNRRLLRLARQRVPPPAGARQRRRAVWARRARRHPLASTTLGRFTIIMDITTDKCLPTPTREDESSVDSPHLLSPLHRGRLRLKNRVVFPGHQTLLSDGGVVGDRMLAYYRERARGGVAAVIVEG